MKGHRRLQRKSSAATPTVGDADGGDVDDAVKAGDDKPKGTFVCVRMCVDCDARFLGQVPARNQPSTTAPSNQTPQLACQPGDDGQRHQAAVAYLHDLMKNEGGVNADDDDNDDDDDDDDKSSGSPLDSRTITSAKVRTTPVQPTNIYRGFVCVG